MTLATEKAFRSSIGLDEPQPEEDARATRLLLARNERRRRRRPSFLAVPGWSVAGSKGFGRGLVIDLERYRNPAREG